MWYCMPHIAALSYAYFFHYGTCTLLYAIPQHDIMSYSMIKYSMVWYDDDRYAMLCYDRLWFDMIW